MRNPFITYASAPVGADRVAEFTLLHDQVIATAVQLLY